LRRREQEYNGKVISRFLDVNGPRQFTSEIIMDREIGINLPPLSIGRESARVADLTELRFRWRKVSGESQMTCRRTREVADNARTLPAGR
jgi:hypothetical protein